jgi:Zn-dependent protease with chaperone function
MNLSYFARLLCLCITCFFLVHLAAGVAIAFITPRAVRLAERLRARNGASFLFLLRLSPFALAVCSVVGLCIPSYLWMEPDPSDESVGSLCLLAVMLFALIWIASIQRTWRACRRSNCYIRQSCTTPHPTWVSGGSLPVWVTDAPGPLIALAGVIRPRLILSRRLLAAFSADEMASALQHERAHSIYHDNLKRLAMLLTPSAFPFSYPFHPLEQAWARLAEWAADDLATEGNPRRSLSMASALVRAARMESALDPLPVLSTALLTDATDLGARVERLLQSRDVERFNFKRVRYAVCAVALLACAVALAALHPATLFYAHEVLEFLIQ